MPLLNKESMRTPAKMALLAAGASVLTEGMAWTLAVFAAQHASGGPLYQLCCGFHALPEAVREQDLIKQLENSPETEILGVVNAGGVGRDCS